MGTKESGLMVSVQPYFCSLIANREKSVLVCNLKPLKTDFKVPIKCYLYCSDIIPASSRKISGYRGKYLIKSEGKFITSGSIEDKNASFNDHVIGEFTCTAIEHFKFDYQGCLRWGTSTGEVFKHKQVTHTYNEMLNFIGTGGSGALLKISDLLIYDKPLSYESFCFTRRVGQSNNLVLKKPPKTWCYSSLRSAV